MTGVRTRGSDERKLSIDRAFRAGKPPSRATRRFVAALRKKRKVPWRLEGRMPRCDFYNMYVSASSASEYGASRPIFVTYAAESGLW